MQATTTTDAIFGISLEWTDLNMISSADAIDDLVSDFVTASKFFTGNLRVD
jgi:hypothetical protein